MQENPNSRRRRMLLVLGMHRSGTSAVTGMLTRLGAWPGTRLIPAAEDNPKGFFEHAEVFAANQTLLEALGSDWDDPAPLPHGWISSDVAREAAEKIRAVLRDDFASASFAVIKDPRLCRLMPLWNAVLAAEGWDVAIVLAVRSPLDAVASMVKRDALGHEEAAGVWLRHELEAEAATRETLRSVIAYEAVLHGWRAQAQHLAAALGIVWPRTAGQAGPDIDAFLDAGLQHHSGVHESARGAGLAPPLADWLERVHAAFVRRDGIATAVLDEIADSLARVDHEAVFYSAPLARLRMESRRLKRERDWQRAEAEGMQSGIARLETQVQGYAAEREKMAAGNARLEAQVRDYAAEREKMAAGNAWLEKQVRNYAADLEKAKADLAQVYASKSWRVTRPLRAAVRRWQRLRGHAAPAPAPAPAVAAQAESPRPVAAAAGSTADVALPALVPHRDFVNPSGHRILIATPDIVGPIRNGGIGTAFHALALTLAAAGHAVTIAYTLGDHCEGKNGIGFWERHYAQFGVRFLPLRLDHGQPKLDAPWHARRAYSLYLWLKANQGDYDIAYFPEWKGEAYYALQARRLGLDFAHLAMVVVTHSPTAWARSGNYLLPTELALLDLDFMERRVAEMADMVVSPSQYMLDWAASCGWQISAPARVIQNLMLAAPANARTGMNSVVVHEWVFFGRLELRKGLLVFLDALTRVPADRRGWHSVTFLGKATKTPEFDPFSLIHDRLGDWPQPVRIIPDYDRDQALAYLKQPGRLAVIASLVENSPYTVLECLIERVPFIAADVGGIAELVAAADRERVLFKPNPGALSVLMARLEEIPYTLPEPAIAADVSKQQWVALQDELRALAQRGFREMTGPLPHITVCLVHHDRPALLARALESLRDQTYNGFDVVLVDDGSTTPAAKRYLRELEPDFARRGWTLVRQENAYLGAARNSAVRQARSEYVMFMDDDNIAKPEELAVFARAARHVDADILTTVSDVFTETGVGDVPVASRELWIPLGNAPGLGVFRNVFGDANALVRRSLFESLGGFTEDFGVGHEDWEFFARASLKGARMYLVPQPLFWYRVDANSMLRAGQLVSAYARSIRPYHDVLPGSIGAALAFALHLQQNLGQPVSAVVVASPQTQALGPIEKFLVLRRTAGWRVVLRRTLRYLAFRLTGR